MYTHTNSFFLSQKKSVAKNIEHLIVSGTQMLGQ